MIECFRESFSPRRFSDRRGAFFVSTRRKTKNSPARTRYNALNFNRLIHLYLEKFYANLPRFCGFCAVRPRTLANTGLPRLLRRGVQNGRIPRVDKPIFGASFLFAQVSPVSKTVSAIGQKSPRIVAAEYRTRQFMSVSLSAIFYWSKNSRS